MGVTPPPQKKSLGPKVPLIHPCSSASIITTLHSTVLLHTSSLGEMRAKSEVCQEGPFHIILQTNKFQSTSTVVVFAARVSRSLQSFGLYCGLKPPLSDS